MRRWLSVAILWGLLLGGFSAQADTNTGLAWLARQTRADGAYSGATDLATPFQSTAETLRALVALGATTQPGIGNARRWLSEQPTASTEYLARQIIAVQETGQTAAASLETLLTHQNPLDGGFGDTPGAQSTVLDTALALEALSQASTSSAALVPAIGFLLAQQSADGSWTDGANPPSVFLSAITMRALWHVRSTSNVTGALDRAQTFLLSQRVESSWATSFETALALIAIVPRLSALTPIAASVEALTAAQTPDGAWSGDVYTTALALRALALTRTTVPNPDLALLKGRVLDGDSGLPLRGVAVVLKGSLTLSAVTGTDGRFQFEGLTSGPYTLTLTLANYSTLNATPSLRSGQTVDLGDLNLLRSSANPTTGTIRGIVTDAQTQKPLAGVTIDANGIKTTSATDGTYQIINVTPGPLTLTASLVGYVDVVSQVTLVAGATVLFSPSLTPETNAGTDAALFGTITDARTGAPLAGTTVSVTGDTVANTQTDAAGAFRIAPLNPGSLTITVTLAGYDSVTAKATAYQQMQLAFSPTLYSSGTTPPNANSASVVGVVVDSTTNQPLAGVILDIRHGTVAEKIITTAEGRFTVSNITAETVNLRFSLPGYRSTEFTLPIKPLSNLDIGQVRLRPEDVQTLLPDLTILTINSTQVKTDPTTLAVSGTLSVEIKNVGTQSVSNSSVILAFSDRNLNGQFDESIDLKLGSATLSAPLEIGTQRLVLLDLTGSLPFRDAPISVWVDSQDHIIENNEKNNLLTSARSCVLAPLKGDLKPVLKWHWRGNGSLAPSWTQVMMAPLVAQTNDDNGDGIINERDDPDVIFVAYGPEGSDYSNGILRIISGRDGADLVAVTNPAYRLGSYSNLAVADIDGDGVIEIIGAARGGGLIAFEHDGTFKWSTGTAGFQAGWNIGGPSIADLDGDGTPEIIYGKTVLNANGSLRWVGSGLYTGRGHPYASIPSSYSIVADLDLDGVPEVVAGPSAYTSSGVLLWQNKTLPDGFTAVGNFDADDFPEIVLVGQKRLYLLEHTGQVRWGPIMLPSYQGGGAPTIADMDGDGQPEIGVAAGYAYSVYKADGSLLWSRPTVDVSSSITGSAVFDFEGDGTAEVVYSDEYFLRVYRGKNGDILVELPNSSGTAFELPVIVDLDQDNHADLIVVSNQYYNSPNATTGIRAFQSQNNGWAPTRSLWNQHSYHINNINDDSTVPRHEKPSWLSHNTYRLNTFPDRNPLDSADLSVALLQLVDNGTGHPASLTARIGNGGLLSISRPIAVAFYQGDPLAGGVLLGTVAQEGLAHGAYADIRLDGVSLTSSAPLYVVVDPQDHYQECNEANNRMSISLGAQALGSLRVSTDASSYGPQSPAQLKASVTNTGSFPNDYSVTLEIVDHSGALVTRFDRLAVSALAAGASRDLSQAWNTATLLVGDYRLRGVLYGSDGRVVNEATTGFTIRAGGTATASLRTTTERAVYHTTDSVRIINLVGNTTNNLLLTAAQLEIRVTGPNGQAVLSETLTVGELTPGAQRELASVLALRASPEGEYTVTGTLRSAAGLILATDQTTFTVRASLDLTLKGTVTALHAQRQPGESQICTDKITYTGPQPLAAQAIRQLVTRLDDKTLIDSKEQTLSLTPSATQTLNRTIETSALSAGDYACVLQAQLDGRWQTLGSAIFKITQPPIKLSAQLKPGERGRVLILLDDPVKHQGKDPLGPNQAPLLAAQRTYLENLLTHAGWSYTITTTAEEFTAKLRTGGYLIYLLLSEQEKLAETVQKEVREAVYRGEGLIEAGSHDQRQGRIDEALRIQFKGKFNVAQALEINDPLLLPVGVYPLQLLDKPLRAELAGAQRLGVYRDGQGASSDVAALTHATYGQGRSVYMGFDLLAEATFAGGDNALGQLLLKALEHVQPTVSDLQPYGVYPLTVTLVNQGIATLGRILLTLPSGVTMIDPQKATRVSPTQTIPTQWQWLFDLAQAETRTFNAWVQLAAGSHALTAQVDSGADPDWVRQALVSLTLTPVVEPELSVTLADTEALGKDYQSIAKRLDGARAAVVAGDFVGALGELIQAADAAIKLNTAPAEALRLRIAALLRVVGRELSPTP